MLQTVNKKGHICLNTKAFSQCYPLLSSTSTLVCKIAHFICRGRRDYKTFFFLPLLLFNFRFHLLFHRLTKKERRIYISKALIWLMGLAPINTSKHFPSARRATSLPDAPFRHALSPVLAHFKAVRIGFNQR